ncbi:ubiquitin carboxyl-terminal hydrolase 12-like isoform X1 [Quercus lobata]|uniref:ubiquitin carboxyl-terminal hydrolase 12-like isoform X1 n=1 Tax=Quercus lobata TaxID=97700 RepID=UPI001244B543|nr:ubiquitin carboxyl-terminal hydrolase 12-like isoform X1 [Quercus lobata]
MLVPNTDLLEGLQPMEVAQAETTSTVEAQAMDDPPSARFTWTIDNFSRLNTKMLYSDVFLVGGYKWRILVFPKGNNVDYLSMYLDVADSTILPYGWSRYTQFSLSVINQIHNKYSIRKETQHQFNARESDWGFTSFMCLGELYEPGRGNLVNDTCIVEADVGVRRVVDYWSHDLKKETGFVGLKNQGATSYMNSLLQTLYHIPYFRKNVYHMPTTENDMPTGSIPLALQSLFYELQYSDTSVATKELTKSFGWDTYDSFMQHDVQELNRVLSEKLEDKMKGTVVEGTIQQLFEGHHMNYIECINVNYKSTRKESFYDLQLDVKGCRDVYASFDKYVEVEHLEVDNKYHAERYGLQDARKGVLFIDFPPVLQLQLKRFMRDTMVKINDRYEFPLELDLDRENGKYLSPYADKTVRNLYILHSVLVHSGGVHGGHYYAYIRPTLSDQWFKFDDERVTKEDVKRALEEQYGGEEELPSANPGFNNSPFKFTKYSNAYMLVYIRESEKEKIICNVDEKDIAEHLRIRLKKEQEEKEQKRKEKAEAHLYTIIKVARNEDLLEQIGRDIYFDLVDHDKVHSFRIQKQISFNLFKEEVAKELGIPVQFQRFWLWAKRQNHTYRPNRPLTPQEEAQSVGQLREVSDKANNAELKLFLEVELGQDLQPVPPPERTKEDILLFFKLYDPSKEELRYVGRLFVKVSGKPVEILPKLNEMAGFSADEEIELYEEIKFEPAIICECIDKTFTFRVSQLEDGDIVCFQKSPQVGSSDQYRYPDVPSFLDYVQNRQVVESVPRAQTKTKVTPSTQEASVQEMTSNEKTESNAESGDSNRVYVENPQKKEDFARATSKDQEGESTQTDSDPLFSLLSPDLRATCSQLLSKYPEMMKDTNKWTLSLRGFLLGQIGFVVSQLQSKGKENCLDLPFDAFLSTLSEAEGLSVNVGWLKSRVTTLRDLKKAGSSVHSSLSSLRELRAKESSCINKAKETESALEVHGTSITQLQESINRLKVELTSKQEVNSALQAQLEGVTAERSYLRKEIEKLEGELGALSHPDFSFENISSLTNII